MIEKTRLYPIKMGKQDYVNTLLPVGMVKRVRYIYITMKLNYSIGLMACLLFLQASAQNLTGRWQWTVQGSGNDIQSDYLIELDLRQEGNRLYGLRNIIP